MAFGRRTWHLRRMSTNRIIVPVLGLILLCLAGCLAQQAQPAQAAQQAKQPAAQQQVPVQQQPKQPAPAQQQQQPKQQPTAAQPKQQQAPAQKQQQPAAASQPAAAAAAKPAPAKPQAAPVQQQAPPKQQPPQNAPPPQQQQQQAPPPPQQQQRQQQQAPPPQQQQQQQQQPPPPPPQQQQYQQQPPPPPQQQQQYLTPEQQQQQQYQQQQHQEYMQQQAHQQALYDQQQQQQQHQYQQRPPNVPQQHYDQHAAYQQQQAAHQQQQEAAHYQQQAAHHQQQAQYQQQQAQYHAQHQQYQQPPADYVPVDPAINPKAYAEHQAAQHAQYGPLIPPSGSQPPPWRAGSIQAMDYKVHIDPGKEDCYYQHAQKGATFHVSFQVIRGGDGMAGFAVRHPGGQIVHPYAWVANSDYTDQTSTGGYYAVCVDNQFARFSGKLVNMYITVVMYEEWTKFAAEIEALQVNMNNFTSAIDKVTLNLQLVGQHQSHRRNTESRDMALSQANYKYVQNWSMAQIFVVILTTTVQVYFVRQLFSSRTGSGHSRI